MLFHALKALAVLSGLLGALVAALPFGVWLCHVDARRPPGQH